MTKYKVNKSDSKWREQLTDAQYKVLREKGTERPYTGKYNMHFENGIYNCLACNNKLFNSSHKFESGCGWPSFEKAIDGSIEYIKDTSISMIRTEIVCSNCGSHLGHVFDDGPTQTGQRYCVNSVSLNFDKK